LSTEPTQAELDAFIAAAGFGYGWERLESWGRRMAEHAVAELKMAKIAAVIPAPDGRGTDAQIERERDIARHAIVGALAAGYAGQAHPGADHWLAAAHDAGAKILSAEQVAHEDAALINRLSTLLASVAVAIKGPEEPLTRHSFHDLPKVAEVMAMQLYLYRAAYPKVPVQTLEDGLEALVEAEKQPQKVSCITELWADQPLDEDKFARDTLKAMEGEFIGDASMGCGEGPAGEGDDDA
jgi:hypothetical protein